MGKPVITKRRWGVEVTEIVTYYIEVDDCETENEAIAKAKMERPGEWQKINTDKEYMGEPLENEVEE